MGSINLQSPISVSTEGRRDTLHVTFQFKVEEDTCAKERLLEVINSEDILVHGWESQEDKEKYYDSAPDFDRSCLVEAPDEFGGRGFLMFSPEYNAKMEELRDLYFRSILISREYIDNLHWVLSYNEQEVFTFDCVVDNNDASLGIIKQLEKETHSPFYFHMLLAMLSKLAD